MGFVVIAAWAAGIVAVLSAVLRWVNLRQLPPRALGAGAVVLGAAGCALALAMPMIVAGQSTYTKNGTEFRIGGSVPGTQAHPHVGVHPSGGFLVWEDNGTDTSGLGISAVALDSDFSRLQAPFRVNQTRSGDQEKPQVVLLSNGGAVFVWQGGRQGFQHIYARFLSSSKAYGCQTKEAAGMRLQGLQHYAAAELCEAQRGMYVDVRV